jgi:hypothetical protein
MIKHRVLSKDELPKEGDLVAIDAEFVALQQEELEFRSDGTKKTLRPSHMSLARVSVLRHDSVPFIDDYILTKETVVDYLTEFSGIKSRCIERQELTTGGDLDPNNSPHTLVPLKVAYKKLRLMVDSGCIFIGHGLAKDFRTISTLSCQIQIVLLTARYLCAPVSDHRYRTYLHRAVPPAQALSTFPDMVRPQSRHPNRRTRLYRRRQIRSTTIQRVSRIQRARPIRGVYGGSI